MKTSFSIIQYHGYEKLLAAIDKYKKDSFVNYRMNPKRGRLKVIRAVKRAMIIVNYENSESTKIRIIPFNKHICRVIINGPKSRQRNIESLLIMFMNIGTSETNYQDNHFKNNLCKLLNIVI